MRDVMLTSQYEVCQGHNELYKKPVTQKINLHVIQSSGYLIAPLWVLAAKF